MGAVAPLLLSSLALAHKPSCQNPLFAVHWAPKIDIQTLNPYPSVKENLKLCPAYNEKSSCCHETFETEQLKFYNIWESLFQEKLLRMDDHRQAVRRAASYLTPKRDSYDVDRAQYRAVMEHYSNVLHSVSKNRCFAGLLTYVAGMICFSCNITWFQYLVLDDSVNHPVDSVLRVRMAPAVCLDLWALCRSFGREVKALKEAIRDSIIARNATLSEENMDLFLDAQALCDWMHDEVALHPFRVRGHEDADLPTPGGIRKVAHARRLDMKYDLDVMLEGQATNFNRTWQDPPLLSSRGQGHARFRRHWLLYLGPMCIGPVASEEKTACVIGHIRGLHHDFSKTQEHSTWLQQFQKTPQAWLVVEPLLTNSAEEVVLYFASHTVVTKLQAGQVPTDLAACRQQLLTCLNRFKNGPSAVRC
eukprot:s5004_g1.t5